MYFIELSYYKARININDNPVTWVGKYLYGTHFTACKFVSGQYHVNINGGTKIISKNTISLSIRYRRDISTEYTGDTIVVPISDIAVPCEFHTGMCKIMNIVILDHDPQIIQRIEIDHGFRKWKIFLENVIF